MQPFYKQNEEDFEIFIRKNRHNPPHLQSCLECTYLLEGTLEAGQGQDLYHMEAGDLAVIFPNIVHHYQVFSERKSRSLYLLASPDNAGPFAEILKKHVAESPVIKGENLDPEVKHCLKILSGLQDIPYKRELCSSYLQIILARILPLLNLVDKETLSSNDLVYQVVSYISGHFQEEITLTGMAVHLGISKYALSRVFSSTFHTNFNTYLNETRLNYAVYLLKYTEDSITDIAMNSGFSSLRTFNRFCQEKLRMTPREYRSFIRQELPLDEDD